MFAPDAIRLNMPVMSDPSGHPDRFATPDPLPPDLAELPPGVLDDQQRVDCELHCRQCGYNLRTIAALADCPECGTAVHWSLVGDLLRFADAAWVKRLAHGMLWMILTLVVSFLLSFVLSAFAGFLGAYTGSFVAMQIIMMIFGLAVTFAAAYAEWCLTTPEPLPAELVPATPGVRGWARWLLMAAAAAAVLALAAQYAAGGFFVVGGPATSVSSIAFAAGNLLDFASTAVGIVGLFLLAVHLRRLARRAPHPGIARQTTILLWAWGIVLGLGLLTALGIWVVDQFTPASNTPSSGFNTFRLMIGLGCGALIAMLTLGIWSLVILIRYHNLFKRHAGYATLRVPTQPAKPLPPNLAPGQ